MSPFQDPEQDKIVTKRNNNKSTEIGKVTYLKTP